MTCQNLLIDAPKYVNQLIITEAKSRLMILVESEANMKKGKHLTLNQSVLFDFYFSLSVSEAVMLNFGKVCLLSILCISMYVSYVCIF